MKKLILFVLVACAFAQQPQTSSPNPQTLQGINAKWSNGVGPGYWPYQKTGTCTGLNLCISPGTVPQCFGTNHIEYAGTSSFALTDNATNYVYIDLDNSCVPAKNTTGYSNRNPAIAKITTVSGAITVLKDDRTWFSSRVVAGGVDARTTTTEAIVATDRMKLVTFSNGGAIAVTLPTTLGITFVFAAQNLGVGTATLTPSSGTINGAANLALATGSGGWFFFDGTNWEAVTGGGGSSTAFQVNGTPLTSSSTVNFENSSAFNGLTFSFSNPSAGNVQLGASGTLDTAGLSTNAVTSAKMAVVNTRRVCMIVIGADNAAAVLANADLGPQLDQCFIPFAATVVEIEVMGDAGTPNVIVQRSHLGSATALLSSALATASAGAVACSNTGGTTGFDATTTCTNTLQNTSVAVGDWIGLTSGTAGGVAKRMSIAVTMTVN